jgi:hypothetical protein
MTALPQRRHDLTGTGQRDEALRRRATRENGDAH